MVLQIVNLFALGVLASKSTLPGACWRDSDCPWQYTCWKDGVCRNAVMTWPSPSPSPSGQPGNLQQSCQWNQDCSGGMDCCSNCCSWGSCCTDWSHHGRRLSVDDRAGSPNRRLGVADASAVATKETVQRRAAPSQMAPACYSQYDCLDREMCYEGRCMEPTTNTPAVPYPGEHMPPRCRTKYDCSNPREMCYEGRCMEPTTNTPAVPYPGYIPEHIPESYQCEWRSDCLDHEMCEDGYCVEIPDDCWNIFGFLWC